ncbi:hypothetical protein FRC15_007698 [Serendipita sp. 397]|nr:hypothetical protein FRC15_007698 [Serendipita sp. 397]KAG8784775.1 hypothetical protein FRC16_002116 [Serendipita sp. 398]
MPKENCLIYACLRFEDILTLRIVTKSEVETCYSHLQDFEEVARNKLEDALFGAKQNTSWRRPSPSVNEESTITQYPDFTDKQHTGQRRSITTITDSTYQPGTDSQPPTHKVRYNLGSSWNMDAKLRRLQKEIADLRADPHSKVTIELVDDSLLHLIGTFVGPPDTPYEGGTYEVDIQIPQTYPFAPPKMKFLTKLYHPNVSSASGAICLDILKDAWSPVLTLKSTMISLQSLLCSPEPKDPQDAEVAKHYLTSRDSFNETAKYWAEIYANAPPSQKKEEGATEGASAPKVSGDANKGKATAKNVDEVAAAGLNAAHVQQFEALGFERKKVIEVLKRLNYRGSNIAKITDDQVVEKLLS